MASCPLAIFLSGPIGVGKSTLGRALASAMGGRFIEGDDHAPDDRPWYASVLSARRAILRDITAGSGASGPVVVACPLRCREWIFYRRRLTEAGIEPLFVSLNADYEAITAARRGRSFDEWERRRILEMIEQGYGEREFSDLSIRTDALDEEATVKLLVRKLEQASA